MVFFVFMARYKYPFFRHSDEIPHPEATFWRVKRLQRVYRIIFANEPDFAKLIDTMYDNKGELLVYVKMKYQEYRPLSYHEIISIIWTLENEYNSQIVWDDDI